MHLSNEEITCYRDHALSPEQILSVRSHCDVCAECRDKLASDPYHAVALRALLSFEPDEQELALFVAGRLPEERAREIEEHAAECPRCAEAVAELREFAAPMDQASKPPVIAMPDRKRTAPFWVGGMAAAVVAAGGIAVLLRPHRSASRPPVASLRDGAVVATLSASGEIGGLPNLDPEERGWIGDVLRTGRLPLGPSISAPPPTVLRGSPADESFQLLSPVDRRVADDKPEFRWESLAGASSYQITVFTEEEKIVAQGVAASNEWRPSAPLPREIRLGWQVTARHGATHITAPAPPAASVFLEVISADAASRIERARRSHLELAVFYAREGLLDEAQAEVVALEADNPGSPLVKQLRQSLPGR